MDILTLHGSYGLASHEDSIRDGVGKPTNIISLHQNFLSLDNSSLHCHHSSAASSDEAAQADDNSTVKSQQNDHSSECVPEAFVQAATVDGNSTYLSNNFMVPVHLSVWTTQLEGNILGEYFGLAMAVCAVGLLRTACLSLATTRAKNWKQTTLDMIEEDALAPMQRSLSEAKHGRREVQKTSSAEEQSDTLLQKINCLQEELLDLKRLRLEDGKANEKVVSIFASKEQAWKEERKNFRDDQQLLCQELQRAYLQQEALSLQLEHLRGLEKQPCADCEHREALFSDLKERFREQEFLIMATVEEAQIEQQEKKALTEKLASVESSISQMQEQLSVEAQKHALELTKHGELIRHLQMKIKQAEIENSQLSQEIRAAQGSISTLAYEKTECEKTVLDTCTEVTQLRCSVQGKENMISTLLKKAKADNKDRTELERELATIRVKLLQAEKENLNRLGEVTMSLSMKTESMIRSRSSFGSRAVPKVAGMIEELQKLHDVEVKTLHSRYEEHMQMLQKRLNLYQERVTDLEEEILLRMSTDAKHMVTYKEHCLNHGEIMGTECMVILKESMEAEVATKQFQLGVAKTLIKQFMDSETHREQDIENWKNLYLASKAAIAIYKEQEHAGPIVPRNPKLQDKLELERSRYALKLEQRHWQEINAFERQIIARDERMEAFRGQLLQMEKDMQKSRRQVEALTQSLEDAHNYNSRLVEELLKLKHSEENKASVRCTKCAACDGDVEGENCSLQAKVSFLQELLTEKEIKYTQSLVSKSGDTPSVLQDRDSKFGVAEAQLTHDQIVFGTDRKAEEELLLMSLKLGQERLALDHHDLNTDVNSEINKDLQGVSYKECLVLRRLSSRIQEAQEHILPEDSINVKLEG